MTACPKCGAALDPDGTCVACLLAGGFGTGLPSLAGVDAVASGTEPSQWLDHDNFGNYRILRVLGEGGMGAVYLAEQTRPLKRQVALKVVKLGLDSSQILSRFNYERQALALMDHPNIAHVYDAGASENGRPYFVMEFVDGPPITQYCDLHRLNTDERLELFVPVCQALQHAHQKGVIHRDIKPSNVMVTEQDGQPVPKVIDFGIAKATEQRAVENAAFTNLGQFIGTPEYMSPEQADVLAGDIDTSSDVYSLGVLLYELLIGAVPFDASMLRKAGLSELLRIIREDEAIPMTAKLTGMGATATEVAGRRRTDPSTLRRQVTGDLNWIVMKAMEKDRQRRYPAVSELAADIRRHLDDQPVLASPPSPMYRTRKFVRRHKLPVIAAAAVLVALVGGIFATSWEAAIAHRERAEALRQRAEALRQRTEALNQRADAVAARALAEQRSRETLAERNRAEEQTALAIRQEEVAERQQAVAEGRLGDVHILADSMLFELNDDVKDLVGGTKARETLVRLGQEYLNKESLGALQDPLRRRKLAESFIKLGELQGSYDQPNLRDIPGARESFNRSLAILQPDVQGKPHDPQLRHLMTLAYTRLAQLDVGMSQQFRGYGRALKSAQVFTSQWPNDPQGMRDEAEIMDSRISLERWSPTKGPPVEAVTIRQQVLAANPTDKTLRWELARSQSILGVFLTFKKNQDALDWLQKSYEGFEALRREEPASAQYQGDSAKVLARMVSALRPLDRPDEAETRARQAVTALETLTAADHRNAGFRLDLSFARDALAGAQFDNGRIAEAIQSVSMAVAIQEEQAARFPDNTDFPKQAAVYYRELASYRNDDPAKMREYRKAEALDRKLAVRYPGRFEFSDALRLDVRGIGRVYAHLGDNASALGAYREAVEIAKAVTPSTPDSVTMVVSTRQSLALGFADVSRWDEAIAEQLAVVALAEGRIAGKGDNPGYQRSLSACYKTLAQIYERHGDDKRAIAASEKARVILEADHAAHADELTTGDQLWSLLFELRNQYARAGDYDRAIAVSQRSVEIAGQISAGHLGDYSRSQYLAKSLVNLGDTLQKAGRRKESLESVQKAISALDLHPVEKAPSPVLRREIADIYVEIAQILNTLQQDEQGRDQQGAVLFHRVLPVLESLAHDHPGNNLFGKSLNHAYQAELAALLSLGDLSGALDLEQKLLNLESPPGSPAAWKDHALRVAHTGSLEMRLERREAALKDWRDALAIFQRAAKESGTLWSADKSDDKKNLDVLRTLITSERWIAFTLEELGDLPQALQYRAASFARAAALYHSDPVNQAYHAEYVYSQREAVRATWLLAGNAGDYRSFYGDSRPTQDELSRTLAQSWIHHEELMAAFGSPPSARLDAAVKAVEFSRQSLARHPSANNRVILAQSLQVNGDVYVVIAQAAVGAERIASYRRSRDSYAQALEILNSVKQSGDLPEWGKSSLVKVINQLAGIDERLPERTGPTNARLH